MRRTLSLLVLLAALATAPTAHAWIWPAAGPVLRPFSLGPDPYAGGQHRGVDIGAELGSQVVAPAAGTVSFAGSIPGSGRAVTIQTADGYAVTLLQLGSTSVSSGSVVTEGAVVGVVGASVDAVTSAPHVHLGVRIAADPDGYVDPLGLLPAPSPAGADAAAEPVPPSPESPAAPAPPTDCTRHAHGPEPRRLLRSCRVFRAAAGARLHRRRTALSPKPWLSRRSRFLLGNRCVKARPPAVPSTLRAEPAPTPRASRAAGCVGAVREGIERRHAERARHWPGGSARPRPDLHTRSARAEADPSSTEAGPVGSEPPLPRRDPESAPRRRSPSGDAGARGGRRGIRPRPARAHVRWARSRGRCRRPGQAQACAYHEWG